MTDPTDAGVRQARHAPPHVRLQNPGASAEERRAAQQARVGILRNPAQPGLPKIAPRDVWRKWPRLRSTRRLCGSAGNRPALVATDDGAAPVDILPDGRALDGFRRALRQPRHPLAEE